MFSVARRARPIWAIDCETDPFKIGRIPAPFLWGIYEGAKELYHEFATVREVLDFLMSEYASNEEPIVYAHNGGKFDYHYLREGFNSDEPIMIIGGRFAKFRIGDCEFRDSLNIFTQTKLEQFGGKIKIDYARLEVDVRHLHIEEIQKYLRQDCVMLYDNLARYFKEYGRGLTQAGSSMRYWAKNYKQTPPKQTPTQFQAMRPFFYGGRVECFQQGYKRELFKVIDINSAYPRAMLEKHPFSTAPLISEHLPSKNIEQCLIRFDGISKGGLPFRTEHGELFFPDDESTVREYLVTGWEFMAALELDALRVVRIKEVYSFSNHVDFEGYVHEFYGKRQVAKAKGDKAEDIFAKIFMNSLFGKFASNPEKYKEWVIASDDSREKWSTEGFAFSEHWDQRFLMTRPVPEIKHRYYNIATAASITGWVRAFLFRSLLKCGNVIYCDTDSIAAGDVSRLNLGTELGQWKVEMDGDEWAVAGKKLYAFHKTPAFWKMDEEDSEKREWKKAHKGVELTAQEIIAAAKGETILYQPKVPTYSALRPEPIFIDRKIRATARRLQ